MPDRHDCVVVAGLDVSTRYSDERADRFEARLLLCAAQRGPDGLRSRLDVDDYAFAQAL